MKTVNLFGGICMPIMGVGTWQIRDQATITRVLDAALGCGYRLIDTAASYGNESMIGEALRSLLPKYGLRREDIFVTSKLRTTDQGTGAAYQACVQTLTKLGLDYLDLYLIHFPGASGYESGDPRVGQLRRGSWQDLEKLKGEGKVRSIGVSNYLIRHLEEMRSYAMIWPPAVDQCEYHPHHRPQDLVEYCGQQGIHFQAYTSLGGVKDKHKLATEPVVVDLAAKYGCSVPKILLAWAMNQGISVLPMTTNPDHVRDNWKAQDIVMEEEDVKKLSSLSTSVKYCWDPAVVL